MKWAIRISKAIVYGLAGAMCGIIAGWLLAVLWTAAFSTVPLNHVWRYIQGNRGRLIFALVVMALGLLSGLTVGVVKGLRGR